MSKILDFYKHNAGTFDFYRCYSCHQIFTREQEALRLANMGEERAARMCACGSRKYQPTVPVGMEWIKPAVLSYTAKLVLARGLAPKLPFLNPLIERLVSNASTR